MTEMAPSNRSFSLTTHQRVCGLIFCLCLATSGAQTITPSTLNAPTTATLSSPITAPANALPSAAVEKPTPSSQAWQKLSPRQKQALAPLGAQWGSLTGTQQSKWLAISQNFNQLSVADQVTMHTRMADWVALSPQQRSLARLNFNQLQSLPKEDKKTKWEAYQALSHEEKSVFSKQSTAPQKSAARTAKPQESPRLLTMPKRPTAENQTPSPVINRKTLLPHPPAVAVPATPASPTLPLPGTLDTPRPAAETSRS